MWPWQGQTSRKRPRFHGHTKLNPEVAAENAYVGYYKDRGKCCYGVFEGIIAELRKEVGPPYTTIPTSMMIYGEGGIAETAANTCGALNGASALIFLTTGQIEIEKRGVAYALINELFNWYEQEALPNHRPKTPKFEISVKSVPRSTLCHASVSNWCKTAKFKAFSKERSERCAWLTASVAKYAVVSFNKNFEGNFKPVHNLSAVACPILQKSCHDEGSVLDTRGTMDCGGCHFTPKIEHPKT